VCAVFEQAVRDRAIILQPPSLQTPRSMAAIAST
jgi:hypothetical protein